MNINIVAVGKIKESYYRQACDEYIKMLGRFACVKVHEIPDEPLSNIKSEADEKKALMKEASLVIPKLRGFVVVLDIKGRKMDSVEFAGKIKDIMLDGNSDITFVIGSSCGLHESVKSKADLRLSFSDMTMPHRLFRVVLLEQIYRAFKILSGETYHK